MTSNAPDSRGACLKIDLEAIARNARALKTHLGADTRMMAVVKANAYGHGLIPVARTALANGASCLGVAVPEEGKRLREAGIDADILVLGNVSAEGARLSVRWRLMQTVSDAHGILLMQKACENEQADAFVHLKIDTGMNRIGARDEDEVRASLEALQNAPRVHLSGAFTHFAAADDADESFSRTQFERFEKLSSMLPPGIIRHAAASDASLRFPWARLDMVREGIALYGCPGVETELALTPAMQLETRVAYVKDVHPGDTVGYGRTYCAQKPMRVATLAIGYGDGYPRACSNRAQVLLGGQMCPVLGRVCMDQMMVDASHVKDVREGDIAVLMGRQGDACITPRMLADWAGTICYEIMCSAHARVPVIYND